MNLKFFRGELFAFLVLVSTFTLEGQDNLAGNASASADTAHVDYPAAGAIDRDTTDGAGWGVSAIDTVNQNEVNIAPKAMASADDFSNPPSEAIDGDTADWTGWSVTASFDVVPHWLELTWESAQSVNRVVLYTNSAGDGAYALRGYTIQYWDGAAYRDIDTVSGNRDARIISTFPPVNTTKIRIYCEEPDSASLWYRINELEVYYVAPTPVEIPSHWLALSWESAQTMNRIVLYTNSAKQGAYALRAYDIQYEEDSEWQALAAVIDNTEAEVSTTFEAVSTSKIRIFCKEPDAASKWYRINEVEVYNDSQTAIEELAESKKDALFVYMDPYTRETVIAAPEEIDQIQVYSFSGILVHSKPNCVGGTKYRIPSGTLPAGGYVAVVNRINSKQFFIK